MKKYMLLCSLALICASESVGKPSDAAKTEKVLFSDDHPVNVLVFDSFVLVDDLQTCEITNLVPEMPVFLKTEPLGIEIFRKGELVPYKQKGHLKAKFHPEHLFNPVKRC